MSLLYFITILNYSLNLYSIITNEYRTHKYNNKIYICMKRKIYLKYKDTIVKILMFYLKFSLKNIIWKKKIEKGEKKRKILGFLN